MSIVTAIVDAHVHIHACHEPDDLFDNAYGNLSRARETGRAPNNQALYLLLTECAADNSFGRLRALALGQHAAVEPSPLKRWSIKPTNEEISVIARNGSRQLFIVAGRQVACREGLEVLVVGTTQRFQDGRPIREILTETDALGVPRIIPWGPGKWLFRRGRLLQDLLLEFRKPTLFLGDEGGRPDFWGYPAHFERAARLGVRDLPGTHPLPFPHDVKKVGRMGFRMSFDLDVTRPAGSLLRALTAGIAPLERFATLESPLWFLRNQIGMQLRKRRVA